MNGCERRSGQGGADNKQTLKTATATAATVKPVSHDELIVPGKSVGKITIRGNADSVIVLLGKPDSSDAAMGSSLMIWYDGHDTGSFKTSIFSSHKFGAKYEAVSHIRKIRTTSPGYKTAEGLRTGIPLDEYRKYYDLKAVTVYKTKGRVINVYEAGDKGIAFEVDSASKRGIAIVVHLPKDTQGTYIDMH